MEEAHILVRYFQKRLFNWFSLNSFLLYLNTNLLNGISINIIWL